MNRKNNISNSRFGFTLIELMITIAIISILAGIAMLSAELIKKEQVSSKNRELLSDIQKLRFNAMITAPSTTIPQARGGGIRLINATSYVLFTFNDCNQNYAYNADGCAGSTREEATATTNSVPGSLALKISRTPGTLTTPANANEDIILFDHFGMPHGYDWSALAAASIVVEHASAGHRKCIAIKTNTLREGTWNGTDCVEQ